MIHICQRLCLVCDWSWEEGQLSRGPPGHVWFHMAQMWHWFRGWPLMMDVILSTDIYMCVLLCGAPDAHMILATLCEQEWFHVEPGMWQLRVQSWRQFPGDSSPETVLHTGWLSWAWLSSQP